MFCEYPWLAGGKLSHHIAITPFTRALARSRPRFLAAHQNVSQPAAMLSYVSIIFGDKVRAAIPFAWLSAPMMREGGRQGKGPTNKGETLLDIAVVT